MTDQKLSPHFALNEFVRPGDKVPHDVMLNLVELALKLERIRERLGNRPITITSGYRTAKHNTAVGGAKNSFHLRGMAADIVVEGMSPKQVQSTLSDWPGGLGLGATFTHLDIRPYKARFSYG